MAVIMEAVDPIDGRNQQINDNLVYKDNGNLIAINLRKEQVGKVEN